MGGHGRDERTASDLQTPGSLEVVDALMEQLDGGTISAAEALEQLLSAQVSLRRERRIISAMRSSRIRGAKTLDSFDFSFQASIDRAQIMNLHQLGFITRKEKRHLPGAGRRGQHPLGHILGDHGCGAGETGILRHPLPWWRRKGRGGSGIGWPPSGSRPCSPWTRSATCPSAPTGPTSFSTGERPLGEGVDRADLQQELPGFC